MEGKRVVPLDEYLPKLRAALRARGGTGFHVTARTDARAALGLDEAIARARAFADAGADAVFVEAPESVEEMARIRAALPPQVTLVANMVEGGKTPVRTVAELRGGGLPDGRPPAHGRSSLRRTRSATPMRRSVAMGRAAPSPAVCSASRS